MRLLDDGHRNAIEREDFLIDLVVEFNRKTLDPLCKPVHLVALSEEVLKSRCWTLVSGEGTVESRKLENLYRASLDPSAEKDVLSFTLTNSCHGDETGR